MIFNIHITTQCVIFYVFVLCFLTYFLGLFLERIFGSYKEVQFYDIHSFRFCLKYFLVFF